MRAATFAKISSPLLLLVALLWMNVAAAASNALSLSEKAGLQAAMQRHIDRHLIDGAYLQMNPDTGDIRKLHPLTAHPIILEIDGYFVLCSDFLDDHGKNVNIDFYLAPNQRSYTVFQTIVDNRKALKRLLKAGKAARRQ